jgi:hypothetical protein
MACPTRECGNTASVLACNLVQHVMEVFFLLICLRIKLQIHEKRYDFHY